MDASPILAGDVSPSQLYLLAQEGGAGTIWLVLGGALLAVPLGLIVVALLRSGDKKVKKSKKVVATETHVDQYRLVMLMMTGQTSQVWEVAETASGRHFAMKFLLPEHVRSESQRYFLFHEVDVGQQIVHPNVIKMLHVVKDREHPYLLMEFFPSVNLKLRLMRKDPLIHEKFKQIVDQAAQALAFMHTRGWIHKDIKPDNILVNSLGEVRLIDFALAQRTQKRRKRRLLSFRRRSKVQGTRSYMSPEQIRGEALDARTDIYSFGATIYELLTGRPPFRAASPGELLTKQLAEKVTDPKVYNPHITNDMSDLVMAMLAKDPEKRPRDIHTFLMKFRSLRPFKIAPAAPKKE